MLNNSNNCFISDYQIYLFKNAENFKSYNMLGAAAVKIGGIWGFRFAVWAPNAKYVSVVGDFNNWDEYKNPMHNLYESGIWCAFVPNVVENCCYKYLIITEDKEKQLKIDPYAFLFEKPPKTASVTTKLDNYKWQDKKWLSIRSKKNILKKPMLIYEVHLLSWAKGENGNILSYKELAHRLLDYVIKMGYTHIELMPILEHPFDGSWGYQVTGYFAPTSRLGSPHDFMYFVDLFHQKNIGVILDWVPAHFPKDSFALSKYDNTELYEYADSRIGEHKGWGTLVFNYRRHEVISFLISSAIFWLEKYHIDGLRVDAVSSMLYLNYCRDENEALKNEYGEFQSLDAISFIKKLNIAVNEHFPNAIMIAEESTSYKMITYPTYDGGLGFDFKWNMGWMNDILKYIALDPIYKKYHHNLITFSLCYAFSENYILPISHDEVVHGKKSLLDKMPGNYNEKFANLRLFFAYMYAHPSKKLLFMGCDFGQFIEWKYDDSLDWHLLEYDMHKKTHNFLCDLNHFYQKNKALWEIEKSWEGFSWINADDCDNSTISFIRYAKNKRDLIVVICNFTPVFLENYIIGVPFYAEYEEVLNTDHEKYGGSGLYTNKSLKAQKIPANNMPFSLKINAIPYTTIYLKLKKRKELTQ